jgi:hypothetical protein
MKKLLFLLFLCKFAYGQEPAYNYMRNNYSIRGVRVDSLFLFPKYSDTTASHIVGSIIRVGDKFYYRDSTKWVAFGSGGGGSTDTTSLSNRIDARVKYTDTASMLSPYLREIDTASLSNRINLKVNISDTSAMLSNYLRKIDTSTLSNRIDLRVKYSDTSSMLSTYLRKIDTASLSNRINLKVNISDTSSMLSPYLRKIDTASLSSRINLKLNISDTSGMLSSYLRKVDTASLSSRINKKIDSLYRSSTNVYFVKNGVSTLAYTDSVGGGQNGRFGSDTATIVMAKVHNDAGVQLTNGKVVYLSSSGTSSDAPSIKLANNKGDSSSANTFGFVSGTIAVNDTGWVVLSGKIEKLNTSAFSNGDIIYLDSVSGQWTKTKPSAPLHQVYLGVVIKANAGNGSIFVKCQNGYELDEIHDVQISGKVNNQILVYSDTQKVWKNRSVYSVIDTSNIFQTKYRTDTMRTNVYTALNGKASSSITLQNVTDNGNQTTQDITANSYYLYDGANDNYGQINLADNTVNFTNGSGMIMSGEQGAFRIYDGSANVATIIPSLSTSRSYTLPDRNGVFVLDADTAAMLSNYNRGVFPIASFGAGSGAAGDTTAFTTSAIYGSFYHSGNDTIILTSYTAAVQGASASITPTIYFNDSLNVAAGATKIVNSPSAVTSLYGATVTSLNNTKIPPGNWVWINTGTVTTKPTYFTLTIIGYRKRP